MLLDSASLYSQEESTRPSTSTVPSDSSSTALGSSSDSRHIQCAINLATIVNQQALLPSAKMYSSQQQQTSLQSSGTTVDNSKSYQRNSETGIQRSNYGIVTARSQSRSSEEGSGSGGLTPSNSSQQSGGAQPAQQTQMPPMGQLGVALQQATGIEAPPSSFPFNNSDLFSSFPTNHNLLQYQMRPELMGLSGFRATNGASVNTV
ncbi:unnamed protein product [Thelazia callipaeda]|uniref:Uncharacterized protein n=1 Tax=Thelazia callipaeda TaxID=103827 RepID=A0A0N5D6T2_THECL|nr:unnamed protein product [Thelazia callipaeda]